MTPETGTTEQVVLTIPTGKARTMSVMKSIRTDPDLWNAAKATAKADGSALATEINDFLEAYVLRGQKKRDRSK